uniref:Uncharacterized protein n=1 Tax=Shewanella putrefaciens (strain 200) TaxID=399804 RepID=E6XG82_SHEP2
MARFVIPSKPEIRKRKVIRSYLKNQSGGYMASLCPDLKDDQVQLIVRKSERSLECDALAYQYGKRHRNFVAIGRTSNDDDPLKSTLTFIFVKDFSITATYEAKMQDAFISVFKKAVTSHDSRIVATEGIDLGLICSLAKAEQAKLHIGHEQVEPSILELFTYSTVSEVLASNGRTFSESMLNLTYAGLFGLTAFGAYKFYQSMQVEQVEYKTSDEWKSYRDALTGRHVVEDLNNAISTFATFEGLKSWSVEKYRSNEVNFSIELAKQSDVATYTDLILWSRQRELKEVAISGDGLATFESALPESKSGDYFKAFKKYQIDTVLNIAQLNDLLAIHGQQAVEISSIEPVDKYKAVSLTLNLENLTVMQISDIYAVFANIPLISIDLSIDKVDQTTFKITHKMRLVGI